MTRARHVELPTQAELDAAHEILDAWLRRCREHFATERRARRAQRAQIELLKQGANHDDEHEAE